MTGFNSLKSIRFVREFQLDAAAVLIAAAAARVLPAWYLNPLYICGVTGLPNGSRLLAGVSRRVCTPLPMLSRRTCTPLPTTSTGSTMSGKENRPPALRRSPALTMSLPPPFLPLSPLPPPLPPSPLSPLWWPLSLAARGMSNACRLTMEASVDAAELSPSSNFLWGPSFTNDDDVTRSTVGVDLW